MREETLRGRLATGIGMGASFTQLDWASSQFREKVGIEPYPGTVNVIIDDPESMPVWIRLKRTLGIRMINPNNGLHDCDAKCWRVSIEGQVDGAIVYPLIADYPPAQVEVIAAVGVRDKLGIEDGDSILIKLEI